MTAEVAWASLQAQFLHLLCHLVITSLSLCFSGEASNAHWRQDGCHYGCSVLIVPDMLLFADEFNNPVHFAINSEGDQIASARAAPADAGWVTSACPWKDRCMDLTAGTLIRTLRVLFLTSSRFGLIQNDSARLDWPAFASSIVKYQIPVLRPPASRSCWPKLDNPWDWQIFPAYQTLPCQQSQQHLLLGGLSAIPFLIYFWMSWPKVECFKTDGGEAVLQWIPMLSCASEIIQCISWVVWI